MWAEININKFPNIAFRSVIFNGPHDFPKGRLFKKGQIILPISTTSAEKLMNFEIKGSPCVVFRNCETKIVIPFL